MTVEEFAHGSPDYFAACELRRRFLREPLGLELTAADTRDDAAHHHFGLFEATGGTREMLGSVIGKPRPDLGRGVVQIRQMVVDDAHRGAGHGRTLLLGAERLLAAKGYTSFVLYARDEAAAFYTRCGYTVTGETTELIGLPHRRMVKGELAPGVA